MSHVSFRSHTQTYQAVLAKHSLVLLMLSIATNCFGQTNKQLEAIDQLAREINISIPGAVFNSKKTISSIDDLPPSQAQYLSIKTIRLAKMILNTKSDKFIDSKRLYILYAGIMAQSQKEWLTSIELCRDFIGRIPYHDQLREKAEDCITKAESALNMPCPICPICQKTECPSCPPSVQCESAPPPLPKYVSCQDLIDPVLSYSCYRKFLTLHTSPNSDEHAILFLTQKLSTSEQFNRNPSSRRNDAMWGAGLSLWLASLLPTVIIGGLYESRILSISSNPPDSPTGLYATLCIPLVGPLVSGTWFSLLETSTSQKLGYSLPWMIGSGLSQIVGFSLLIAGARTNKSIYPRSRVSSIMPVSTIPAGIGFSF